MPIQSTKKRLAVELVIESILGTSKCEEILNSEKHRKAFEVYNSYILKNKGLLTFKLENPYYCVLILSELAQMHKSIKSNKYKLALLQFTVANSKNELSIAKSNKAIVPICEEFSIDLSANTDELTALILNKLEFTSEAQYMVAILNEHIKITKLNKAQKEKYLNIINEVSMFINEDATETTKNVETSENIQDKKTKSKKVTPSNPKDDSTSKSQSTVKSKKSKVKASEVPKTSSIEVNSTVDKENEESKLKTLLATSTLNDVANMLTRQDGSKIIAIREEDKEPYVLDNAIIADFANMIALNSGISNKLRMNLKLANREKDNLSKLTLDKNSPVYNSVIYDVRLYKDILDRVVTCLNSFDTELATKTSKDLKLTGIKSAEFKRTIENANLNLDAIKLKVMSDSLSLLSVLMTLKNSITTNNEIETDILKTELSIIYTTLGKIINNMK